jgi:hypothetical protein
MELMCHKEKIMTLDEKLTTLNKASALRKAGDIDGFDRLTKSVPLPPYMAQFAKEKIGVDFLIDGGWNLSEAEAEFGKNWLN